MSVDRNEAPIGYEARQSMDGCEGCAFMEERMRNGDRTCLDRMPSCFCGKRADDCSAIFVKKEKVIDPAEAPKGYIAVVTTERGCRKCDLYGKGDIACLRFSSSFDGIHCTAFNRKDGCDVIFKKAVKVEVNPNEAPEGFIAVARTTDGCAGCIYMKIPGCLSAECHSFRRKDGCNVVFVRREEKNPSFPKVEISDRVMADLWAAITSGLPHAKGNTNDEASRCRVALKIWDGVRKALGIE